MSSKKSSSGSMGDQLRNLGLRPSKKKPVVVVKRADASPDGARSFKKGAQPLKASSRRAPAARPESAKKKGKKKQARRAPLIPTPVSIADIHSTYGGSRKPGKPPGQTPRKEPTGPELKVVSIPIKVGEHFRKSIECERKLGLLHRPDCWSTIPVQTRLDKPRVMQLGLDMGTSTTKVVVMDPAKQKDNVWAVPFFGDGEGRYLLPTAVDWQQGFARVHAAPGAQRPFKWTLLRDGLSESIVIDAAAYLALVLRHVVAWLNQREGDYYRPENLIWELRVGFPAKSLEDQKLVRAYLWLLDVAVALASSRGPITKERASGEARFALQMHDRGEPPKPDRNFIASGMLVPKQPSPEIAAAIAGFRRSDQWDPRRPYGLLLDVGASTVDTAYCSFQGRDETRVTDFVSTVEPLGVVALHESRVEWLKKALKSSGFSDGLDQLLDELLCIDFDRPIPDDIGDYLDGVEILLEDPERAFRSRVVKAVMTETLVEGKKRFFGERGGSDIVIPVYTSGGGMRHPVYKNLLSNFNSGKSTTWSIEVKPLRLPSHVNAPGLSEHERDRLLVAYGLCVDSDYVVNFPDSIDNMPIQRVDYRDRFVGKDDV